MSNLKIKTEDMPEYLNLGEVVEYHAYEGDEYEYAHVQTLLKNVDPRLVDVLLGTGIFYRPTTEFFCDGYLGSMKPRTVSLLIESETESIDLGGGFQVTASIPLDWNGEELDLEFVNFKI